MTDHPERDGHPGPPDQSSVPSQAATEKRPGTLASLYYALLSWRTAAVVLLSFSSGLPLGFVWIAIPDWLADSGVDIRIVGLFTLAQVPWTFNVLWAPLMERWRPPFFGRRRGWAAVAQVCLMLATIGLGGVANDPNAPLVVFAFALAIGIAAASQDIAIDGYAVDVLRREEQGVAVGARIGLYRVAMFVAGGSAITLADRFGWSAVCIGLGLLYVPMLMITAFAPEPQIDYPEPTSLAEAIWKPFVGFLSRDRALEILAFVLLFKFADNFAQSLLRPFLVDMGYTAAERGVALSSVGLLTQIGGAILGGVCTNFLGLGRALWVFGLLQIFSNVGYLYLAHTEHSTVAMVIAMGFETLCQGMGTGAFSVLLLRMTQKRFSATQYALFSTLFGMGRIFSGPIAGFTVDAAGWSWFFIASMVLGIPGLVMLHRFVPWGTREPHFEVREPEPLVPLTREQLLLRGGAIGVAATVFATLVTAALQALKAMRSDAGTGFDFALALEGILQPADLVGWIRIASLLAVGLCLGLLITASMVARRSPGLDDSTEEDPRDATGANLKQNRQAQRRDE